VVAIFVKKGEACEWKSGAWKKLDPEAMFSDPTLARPLRVRALLDAAEADNAVASALLAKGNPVMAQAQEESLAKGRAEGLRAGVRDLCELLSIAMTAEREEAIKGMTASELDALRERIKRARRWE
jgi:hypothetical protein